MANNCMISRDDVLWVILGLTCYMALYLWIGFYNDAMASIEVLKCVGRISSIGGSDYAICGL